MHRTAAAFLILELAGCSQQALLEKFAPAKDQDFAKSQIALLKARDFDSIESALDSDAKGPDVRDNLSKMADLLPAAEPISEKLVGAYVAGMGGETTSSLTFEYEYPEKWLLIHVATRKTAFGVTLVDFRVIPLDSSLEEQNRFTLSGKSVIQYVVLALAIVVPLFILYALVVCIRTPLQGRKWPWVLFILVGFGQIAVNWTTGEWELSQMRIQLFGASFMAPLYGPWTIAVSVPLGAIWFLARRDKLRKLEILS